MTLAGWKKKSLNKRNRRNLAARLFCTVRGNRSIKKGDRERWSEGKKYSE